MGLFIDSASQGLEGQLLIATPQLVGSCFEKAVIYMCAHNQEGAMGLIINQRLPSLALDDVFQQLDIIRGGERAPAMSIHFGGPVETARGFVLHSPEYALADTVVMDDYLALTCNIDVLKDIASGGGPERAMLALGYAGWGPGQLESEFESNSWISAPASAELIFSPDDDEKWRRAAASEGIDLDKLAGHAGHA
jgi:putative transcriptional regulator